jgi:ATP-dependent RNA helicase DDX51/DBP6
MSSESDEKEKNISHCGPARKTVLIFTKSSESASRLSRLISLLDPSLANRVGTIIKSNKSSASRKTLTAYRRGKISVIVATDRASRGLDLESLTHVVNYDVPPSVTTYVHRVGRTARAGKEGSAWTLVAHREGRWFVNEISKGLDGKITRSTKVERVNVKLDTTAEIKSRYAAALDALEKEVKTGGSKSTKPQSLRLKA